MKIPSLVSTALTPLLLLLLLLLLPLASWGQTPINLRGVPVVVVYPRAVVERINVAAMNLPASQTTLVHTLTKRPARNSAIIAMTRTGILGIPGADAILAQQDADSGDTSTSLPITLPVERPLDLQITLLYWTFDP